MAAISRVEASSTLLAITRTGVEPTKEQRHPFVLGGDTDGRIDDEQDDFGLPHCLFGLLGHLVIERIAIGHPAARVEEGEVIAEPFGIDRLAVASDAGALFDDRLAAPDDAVHHGGFAHVGTTDNGDDRQAHAVDSRARRRAAPSVEMTSTGRGRSETLIPSRKTPAQADVWQKIAVAFGFSFEHSGNVLADHQAGDADVATEVVVGHRDDAGIVATASPRPTGR